MSSTSYWYVKYVASTKTAYGRDIIAKGDFVIQFGVNMFLLGKAKEFVNSYLSKNVDLWTGTQSENVLITLDFFSQITKEGYEDYKNNDSLTEWEACTKGCVISFK